MDYIPAEAFDELWEKYNKRVYYYFRRQFDEDTAEDLCQQTFMKVWQYLCSYCGKIQKPRPWIFAVAKNVKNDYLRTVQSRKANYDYTDLCGKEIPVEYDFDEAMSRSRSYADFEKRERESACNLFKKEIEKMEIRNFGHIITRIHANVV